MQPIASEGVETIANCMHCIGDLPGDQLFLALMRARIVNWWFKRGNSQCKFIIFPLLLLGKIIYIVLDEAFATLASYHFCLWSFVLLYRFMYDIYWCKRWHLLICRYTFAVVRTIFPAMRSSRRCMVWLASSSCLRHFGDSLAPAVCFIFLILILCVIYSKN